MCKDYGCVCSIFFFLSSCLHITSATYLFEVYPLFIWEFIQFLYLIFCFTKICNNCKRIPVPRLMGVSYISPWLMGTLRSLRGNGLSKLVQGWFWTKKVDLIQHQACNVLMHYLFLLPTWAYWWTFYLWASWLNSTFNKCEHWTQISYASGFS